MLGVWMFYTVLGILPLGLAIYLFVSAKGRVDRYAFGVILLLIAITVLAGSVVPSHRPSPH